VKDFLRTFILLTHSNYCSLTNKIKTTVTEIPDRKRTILERNRINYFTKDLENPLGL